MALVLNKKAAPIAHKDPNCVAVKKPFILPKPKYKRNSGVIAELPNSYMKRRLGIAAGATPDKNRWLFTALDQIDSGIGVAVAYGLFLDLPLLTVCLCAITFPFTALGVKRLLFMAKLKKSAT